MSLTIDELRETVGDAATISIVHAYGGSTVKIPSAPQGKAWARFSAMIGNVEHAAKIVRIYACCELYVPRCTESRRELRNRQIRELLSQGVTASELARTWRGPPETICQRTIMRIKAEAKNGSIHLPGQLKLFEDEKS